MTNFGYRRLCTRCGQSKPMAGGWTSSTGRRFVCAQCRPKPGARVPERPAA